MHALSGPIDFDTLRALSRLGPRATMKRVERWASAQGILYRYDGNGGIWTTTAALDKAVGIDMSASNSDQVDASVI